MEETAISINEKNSILLSRNTPVALVVGAAGFLGSHLTEALLSKNIQVIGIDNFSTGKRINLENTSKDKNFHLIDGDAEKLETSVPRLDYLFVVAGPDWKMDKVLELAKEHKSKVVFVSTVELYEASHDNGWYKISESKLARYSEDHKLNARVVRLSAIFGPRMHFMVEDPTLRLIQAALLGELQKQSDVMEFSSRALYMDDAVDLIIKSMLSGSTALKIFDGALLTPIKVSEIKQVLLDPLWYENKGFEPTELPPWSTPNLEKTMKILNWRAKTPLVKSLKETISYFKDHEINIPKVSLEVLEDMEGGRKEKEESREPEVKLKDREDKWKELRSNQKGIKRPFKFAIPWNNILTLFILAVIVYGLIFPISLVLWGMYSFNSNLEASKISLSKGEFDQSLKEVGLASQNLRDADELLSSLDFLYSLNFISFKSLSNFLKGAILATEATQHTIMGSKSLYSAFLLMGGQKDGDLNEEYKTAQSELALADEKISKAKLISGGGLSTRLDYLAKATSKSRVVANILPSATSINGKKSYLVILQNSHQLRPTGGLITSLAKIDFDKGKIAKIEAFDVMDVDSKLELNVEPPKEIKIDLGIDRWLLKDANWEPDFPTSARQIMWFHNKETGERVDGVISLDLYAVKEILKAIGPISLSSFNESITADNVLEKSLNNRSVNDRLLLTSLLEEVVKKVFLVPHKDATFAESFDYSLEGKHMMFYLSDPKLFSYIASQNWIGVMPRAGDVSEDFLAPVEANMGENQVNFYLQRRHSLQTSIDSSGNVSHKLVTVYTNNNSQGKVPVAKYKNRLRIYLPLGSQLLKAMWGSKDITRDISTFADYGRSGFTYLLELEPGSDKTLTLDYKSSANLKFENDKTIYKLDVIKQSGTDKDSFEWNLNLADNLSLEGEQVSRSSQKISTDLSQDRRFEVTIKR